MLRSLTIAAAILLTTIGAQAQAEAKGDYADVNGMRVYQENLTKTRAEQAQIRSSFTADITRFKELKGIK